MNKANDTAKKTVFTKARHPLGFYQASPIPSQEELEKHYRETYFQGGCEFYLPEYCEDEKKFIKNRPLIAEHIWRAFTGKQKGEMMDVGCGEGFFASHFAERGWKVSAADFSSHGIQKHNPQLLPNFTRGNIYSILEDRMKEGNKYDLVNLSNVCEHVPDPLELLDRLRSIMYSRSLLQIIVPNDFSEFQELIVEKKHTDETWFSPPEHINYFTFSSFRAVLENRGFKIVELIAGFPIEIFLFNEHSNYWKDRKKGRQAHMTRVHVDNFLMDQGIDKYIRMMSASAECNFGRAIIAFAALSE
jgi:SAM-dependent methyltransferase